MLSSQYSNDQRGYARRFLLFAVVLTIVGLASLALTAPGSSSAARKSPEKSNVRIGAGPADVSTQSAGQFAALATMPLLAAIDVDRTDDVAAASACTAAPNDCSLRGAVAFANIVSGTTINVPSGTYSLTISGVGEGFSGNNAIGDLDIRGNNTAIIGAGAATTIIDQTINGARVIEVNPFLNASFITSVSGVTISGGRESAGVGGGGIIAGAINNLLTLTDCVFSGNSATGAGTFGGGGVSHTGGSLTVTGCTFSGNSTSGSGGGVSYSAGDGFGRVPSIGTLSVTGSTFTNNTANSSAAGGGALDLFNFNGGVSVYNVSSSSFTGNNAPNARGGAIIVESGPLTLTTSSLANNHAASGGGGIYSSGSAVSVAYSRLVGNTSTVATNGNTFFRQTGLFTGDDNWWGIDTGPAANDFRGNGGVNITPATWLQLQTSASPDPICSGASSTINANIKKRNTGLDLTVELNGLPPFPATFINATPALGNLSGVSPNFVNGAAAATFTAGGTAGTAMIDVTADNQITTASVGIQTNTTSDPANQALCEGGTADFSTTSSGPGPFTYVWKKGATVLNNGDLGGRVTITSGPDTSTLSISNVQASDADTYTVEATGQCNTTSQTATLSVNSTTTTSDPADQTVCQGTDAIFSTTASGTGPFSYAWKLDGSPFGGDTSSITVPTGSLSVGNHTVEVTVTGACNSTTQSATLTVQENISTTDPADQTVCQGATANFSTTASGTGPFTYAWTVDGSPFGGNTSSISVDTTSLSIGNHAVSVTVTGACGNASQSATLTVQENISTTDPANQTVCQGAAANFSTTASGTGPFTYAWTVDGSPFGGNTSSISVDTTSLSVGNHAVSVTVTGACGNASQNATLTVQENISTTDPANQTVCQGATANFSTTASGTGPFTYAWIVDGSPFGGNTSSISVDTTSLSVGNHAVSVTVTGACGNASQNATLTVQENTTTTDPADQTVCQGAPANFSTTASGTGPFTYAWTVDGSPFGGNTSSISVDTTSLSIGNHAVSVTVTGACGSASQNATLTVQENTSTTDPADQTVCQGVNANFSTTAGGTGPFHYAWTLDGMPFNGDSPSISVPTGSLSQGAHSITVTTTGTCGSASQSATLTVNNDAPVITVGTPSISIWPPNHKYQTFNISDFNVTANSNCNGNITNNVVIASVTSDEVDDNPGGGDGNTINDIVIAANCKSVQPPSRAQWRGRWTCLHNHFQSDRFVWKHDHRDRARAGTAQWRRRRRGR